MYIVRFIRNDEKPNEDYYYISRENAQNHFDLYSQDESKLYRRIMIIVIKGEEIVEINDKEFSG